jgi:sigma-B regulation protein RsbU (phosphoserine phosphatase)
VTCGTTDGGADRDAEAAVGADTGGEDVGEARSAQFAALLEDSAEDLYDNAPCGYLSTLMDGRIAKVNATLLDWLGYRREELVARKRFSDLLTVGGRLYHETHFAPLLAMQQQVSGIALELKGADGRRLPVLVTSVVKTGAGGQPLLIRTTIFDARDRRAYENELLRARKQAEEAGAEAEEARRVAEAERARLQQVVAILQKSLLPPALPRIPGLDAAAYYHPASVDEIGGDFYDLFPLGGDSWGFFLGDVCGKGPEAASVTSMIRYTLRAAFLTDSEPVHTLTMLDTALRERYAGESVTYCTAIVGTLTTTPDGVAVRLASGGHPPALLLRADGTAETVATPGGTIVGVLPVSLFVPATVVLAPGETLLLYTDGLFESRTKSGRRYSEQALHAFAQSLAPASAQATIHALRSLLVGFGAGLEDDSALLALGNPAR